MPTAAFGLMVYGCMQQYLKSESKFLLLFNITQNSQNVQIKLGIICFQANVAKEGARALDVTMDFDELAVLKENISYLTNTLEVLILY